MKWVVIVLMILSSSPQAVAVQAPDMDDVPFVKMLVVIMMYDYYANKCEQRGGFSIAEAAKIAAWRNNNSVDKIRAHLRDLEQDAIRKKVADKARADIYEKLSASGESPCQAAIKTVSSQEAQFATTSPNTLEILGVTTGVDNRKTQTAAVVPGLSPKAQNELLSQIDSFGFNTRPKMGIGGFIMLDIYPIVFFRNEDLLNDIEGLNFAGGIAAHRRVKPEEWTRWRRSFGKLEIHGEKGWETLEFQTTYPKLPNDFRLNGLFRSLSGGGTIAVGGNQSIAAWNDYRFSPDGRVVRGGGAGGRSEAGDISVATSSVAPNQRGKYRIDGLTLQIKYDDGSSESRILVTDPKDPKSVIWLDGVSYVRRNK